MENSLFYSDMAVDNLENGGLKGIATHKKLSYGVEQIVVRVGDNALSRALKKDKGVYVTFDTSKVDDERYQGYLSGIMANTLRQLVGHVSDGGVILAVGLGNGQVLSDSLGKMTVDKVRPTRVGYLTDHKYLLCTHTLGVEGVTGVKSIEVLTALNDKIKPSAILIVDTLVSSNANRIGRSFQISTAGITPGSGVGGDKPKMDKAVFGVPTVSIGVPLVLSMHGVLKEFSKEYLGGEIDENKFLTLLTENRLSRLVVAPKEVRIFLDNASNIIAKAINLAYSK